MRPKVVKSQYQLRNKDSVSDISDSPNTNQMEMEITSPNKEKNDNDREVDQAISNLLAQKENKDLAIVMNRFLQREKEIITLKEQNAEYETKLNMYDGRICRLENDVEFWKEKVLFNEKKQMENNVIVKKYPEPHEEKIDDTVKNIITDLKLQSDDLSIDLCHRFGSKDSDNPRPILIRFTKKSDARTVLSSAKNLKGKNYSISGQVPQEYMASQQLLLMKRKELKAANPEAKVVVRDEVLLVDKKVEVDLRAMRHTLSDPETSDSDIISSLKVTSTPVEEHNGSYFRGHFVPIKHLREVRAALSAIYAVPGVGHATHNMFAVRIGSSELVNDDREYGGAMHVLKAMRGAGAKDALCVVTRWFGGIHLGRRPFDIIRDVAQAAVLSAVI